MLTFRAKYFCHNITLNVRYTHADSSVSARSSKTIVNIDNELNEVYHLIISDFQTFSVLLAFDETKIRRIKRALLAIKNACEQI